MSRAVVLSGGGSVGIAWQTGLVAGLAAEGVDLSNADFVLGTSAGSAVGAQIALGRDLLSSMQERFSPARKSDGAPRPAAAGASQGRERMRALVDQMTQGASPSADPKAARAALGRVALEADTVDEASFIRGFAHLAGSPWPTSFRCTAVDAESGRFKVWDVNAGVDLAAAVASSCAVPGLFPPITLDGRRYMDGGMRTGTNADIAKGYARTLIITLMGNVPERELSLLRDAGAHVEIIAPDAEAATLMGMDLMNAALAPDAAQSGLRQGKASAEQLRAFWS